MRARYDVVVVGAGPAGATAAYHAASFGLTTLLVDRKRFPRSKVCGDGLSPRALRALARMGLGDLVEGRPRLRGVKLVDGPAARVVSYDDEPLPFNFGTVVPRAVLDNRIRLAAEQMGADFVDDALGADLRADASGRIRGVTIACGGERVSVEASMTIVADGALGRLGRALRGERRPSCAAEAFAVRRYVAGLNEPGSYFEIHLPTIFRGRTLVGYAWIFPVSHGSANVGVGVFGEHPGLDGTTLPAVLEAWLSELRERDGRFRDATALGCVEGGALNTRMANPFMTPPGVLLVGDAAGLVNPFTAEGIAAAVESGELAARATKTALDGGPAARVAYGRPLVARFRRSWAVRAGPRHGRWLLSLRTIIGREGRGVLSRALRSTILDLAAERPRFPEKRTERLARRLETRVRRRLRAVDPFLAEVVVNQFRDPASGARLPALVASRLAEGHQRRDPVFMKALEATTLFTLAHEALGDLNEEAEASANEHAAILVADCLLVEANACLVSLPGPLSRLITSGFREAAARGVGAAGAASRGHDEAQVAARLAAQIALRTRPSTVPSSVEQRLLRWVRRYVREQVTLRPARAA
jgi:geranylgeranyl reductase family protein